MGPARNSYGSVSLLPSLVFLASIFFVHFIPGLRAAVRFRTGRCHSGGFVGPQKGGAHQFIRKSTLVRPILGIGKRQFVSRTVLYPKPVLVAPVPVLAIYFACTEPALTTGDLPDCGPCVWKGFSWNSWHGSAKDLRSKCFLLRPLRCPGSPSGPGHGFCNDECGLLATTKPRYSLLDAQIRPLSHGLAEN